MPRLPSSTPGPALTEPPAATLVTEAARSQPANDAASGGGDRRRSPRRRLRDRIASLDRTSNPALRARHELRNVTMLVEDDLREAALAIGRIEAFLQRAAQSLEDPGMTRAGFTALVDDTSVGDSLEDLGENLDNLRRRIGLIAASL